MGGPGSGRKKSGGSKGKTKEQATAARNVMIKRRQAGANNSSIHAWKKGLIARHPNLTGKI